MGFEPMTSSLPRKCSTPELQQRKVSRYLTRISLKYPSRDINVVSFFNYHSFLSGKRDSNPRPLAWKANALSTELFPQYSSLLFILSPKGENCSPPLREGVGEALWAKMDSNHRRYQPADLQSAPFGHSGIRPYFLICQSLLSDSNQRPRDYKSRALAN